MNQAGPEMGSLVMRPVAVGSRVAQTQPQGSTDSCQRVEGGVT
jgi:hypothetical protein